MKVLWGKELFSLRCQQRIRPGQEGRRLSVAQKGKEGKRKGKRKKRQKVLQKAGRSTGDGKTSPSRPDCTGCPQPLTWLLSHRSPLPEVRQGLESPLCPFLGSK